MMVPLSDEELEALKSEHVLDTYPHASRARCRAASEDACGWNEEWPCRTARLIAMVEAARYVSA